MDREVLARALGRVPSGLYVVTVRAGDRSTAFLGSWIQQAGFEPPVVSVAVKSGRPAQELLDEPGARFAVNVIPAGGSPLIRHFAKGFGPGEDPYAGIAVQRGSTGVEILPEALAVLECVPAGSWRGGDHVVIFGEVREASVRAEAGEPAVHIRKNGLSY